VWVSLPQAMVCLSGNVATRGGVFDSPLKVILAASRISQNGSLALAAAASWRLHGQPMKLPILPTTDETMVCKPMFVSLEESLCLCAASCIAPAKVPFTQPLNVSTTPCSTDVGDELSHCDDDDDSVGQDLDSDAYTSVILKNLPQDCTRQILFEVLAEHGFIESVNFLYLPMTFDKVVVRSLRYAFISFTNECVAERFFRRFSNFSDWRDLVPREGGCRVEWSALQGLQAHIDRYRNSPIMHPSVPSEYRPMQLVQGMPVPFPPTKQLEAPRLRRRKDQS